MCKYSSLPGERKDPGVVIFVGIQKLDSQEDLALLFFDPPYTAHKVLVGPGFIKIIQAASNQYAVIHVDRKRLLRSYPYAGTPGPHVPHHTLEADGIR